MIAHTHLHRLLFAVALTGLALGTPRLNAQAQSLLTSNQVVISRVENITPDMILISGINFDKFANVPVVSLSYVGTTVTTVSSSYDAGSRDITAILPANVAGLPGSYRLMVSFGSGTAGTDVFEFTVGAVGPQGVKGETGEQGIQGIQGVKGETGAQGIQGIQGETGAQGIQGVQGDKGDTGAQGVQGIQGETGAQGIQGVKGDKGDTGEQGPRGFQGETGAQGVAGASGNFPIFQNVTAARAAGILVGQVWVQASSGQVFQMVK